MVPLVAKALGGSTCLEDFPLNFASRVLDVVVLTKDAISHLLRLSCRKFSLAKLSTRLIWAWREDTEADTSTLKRIVADLMHTSGKSISILYMDMQYQIGKGS